VADNTTSNQINRGYLGVAGIFDKRRIYDMSDEMIFMDRAIIKFWNMLSRNMTKMKVGDPEPRMLEFTPKSNVFTLYAGTSDPGTTGTTFSIANTYAAQLQADDLLKVVPKTITGALSSAVESVRVDDVGSAGANYTDVTVVRNGGKGGTGINVTVAGYDLIWIGNAHEDGAAGGYPIAKDAGYFENYIQTFSKKVGETRMEKNTKTYGKKHFTLGAKSVQERELLLEEINFTFYTGKQDAYWKDGSKLRMTGGVASDSGVSAVSLASKMGIPEFLSVMESDIFDVGRKKRHKVLYCGGGLAEDIDAMGWSESMYQMNPKMSEFYGFDIKDIRGRAGRLSIVHEESFRSTGFYNAGVVIDPDYVAYMMMDDLQIDKNIIQQQAKWNREEWILFGDLGLFFAFAGAHKLVHSPSAP
jgi:hypothetical protein